MSWIRRAVDFPYFDNGGLPLAFAHRGGALAGGNVGLENTMVAFQSAVDLGYRYVETDVHAALDGTVMAFHDATLDRTTNASGPIAARTIEQLDGVLIDGREPIPTLAEIFSSWPDLCINIDAKSAQSIRPLAAVIDSNRAWDRVCAASNSLAGLHDLRRTLDKRCATSLSVAGVGALMLVPTGVLRSLLLGHSGQAAQVPPRRGRLEVVTPRFVERAHQLGKQVHAWTIDAPDEMHRLLDLDVDAIMTDRIDILRDVYRERGVWQEAR